MRKIIVGAQVSLDGVMQSPGGRTEDPTDGFALGGWAMPYFDAVAGEEIQNLFDGDFALLLGRKTYEIFAAFWPYQSQQGPDGWIAKRFDEITKVVVSRSGELDAGWARTQVVRSIEELAALRAGEGPPLVTQGSTELVHALFASDLVDELGVWTVPVVLGGGKKLFADGSTPHAFRLTSSRAAPSGMVVTRYERAGGVETTDMQGEPSEREKARQARMKREG